MDARYLYVAPGESRSYTHAHTRARAHTHPCTLLTSQYSRVSFLQRVCNIPSNSYNARCSLSHRRRLFSDESRISCSTCVVCSAPPRPTILVPRFRHPHFSSPITNSALLRDPAHDAHRISHGEWRSLLLEMLLQISLQIFVLWEGKEAAACNSAILALTGSSLSLIYFVVTKVRTRLASQCPPNPPRGPCLPRVPLCPHQEPNRNITKCPILPPATVELPGR